MYNILVCDDDREIVEAIEIYLSKEGYNVIKAYDGLEAIEILKKEDIQLLIADTIFLHDIFNEEALRVKCSILYKKDKRSIAKSTYDNFCKQYKSLLGTDYKISFSTIVTSKTTS